MNRFVLAGGLLLACGTLAPAAAFQTDERDLDPDRFPAPAADAERLYRLALCEPAERVLRELLRHQADEQLRLALCRVLHRGRRFAELKREAESLKAARDPQARAFAHSFLAVCAWKDGQAEEAKRALDRAEAERTTDGRSATAFPAIRMLVRMTRACLDWKRHECGTHVLHYPPDWPEAGGIIDIGRRLDDASVRIHAILDIPFEGKIDGFLFNDQVQGDEILGWPLSFAAPRDRAFFAVHGAPLAHLTAHVLSFHTAGRERPRSGALIEGFAAAVTGDESTERRLDSIPADLLRKGELPELPSILRSTGGGTEFAAVSGSFVRWLLRARGRERFRRLWGRFNDYGEPWSGCFEVHLAALGAGVAAGLPDPWTAVYSASLRRLEEEWRSSIR